MEAIPASAGTDAPPDERGYLGLCSGGQAYRFFPFGEPELTAVRAAVTDLVGASPRDEADLVREISVRAVGREC